MSENAYCPKCGAACQQGDQFCKGCGNNLAASAVTPPPTAPPVTPGAEVSPVTINTNKSEKSATTAFLLNMFLGYFGAHRFYVGKIGTGILMLLTLGGLGIWALIDYIVIASSKFKDKNGRYLEFISTDPNTTSIKSGNTALLLSMFLGLFGIHRFYVGKIGTGILMLLTLGGFGIWTLIDIITIACGNFTDKRGQFLRFSPDAKPSTGSIAAIICLFIASLLAFAIILFSAIFIATSGLTEAARNQLSALREHDYAKAYSYTSADFQRATSLEQFEQFVQNYPALSDNKDSTFPIRSLKDSKGVISGVLEARDGTMSTVIFEFVKEQDQWKILNINVEPQDAGVTSKKKEVEDNSDNQ